MVDPPAAPEPLDELDEVLEPELPVEPDPAVTVSPGDRLESVAMVPLTGA